jgi:hypothetical protein
MARLLRALSRQDWTAAAALVDADEAADGPEGVRSPSAQAADAPDGGRSPSAHATDHGAWTAERFARALTPFFQDHTGMRSGPGARASDHTQIHKRDGAWDVVQVIADAEGDDDWALSCTVDLAASSRAARPVIRMRDVLR